MSPSPEPTTAAGWQREGSGPSPAEATWAHDDAAVDEMSAESMDASDPPSFGGVTGIGAPPPEAVHAAKIVHTRVLPSDADRDEITQQRAYELWERAGRPSGTGADFWQQAEHELSEIADCQSALQRNGRPG